MLMLAMKAMMLAMLMIFPWYHARMSKDGQFQGHNKVVIECLALNKGMEWKSKRKQRTGLFNSSNLLPNSCAAT
jgi:hypothetical protein